MFAIAYDASGCAILFFAELCRASEQGEPKVFSRTLRLRFSVLLTAGFLSTTVDAATFTLLSQHVVALDGSIELGDCERWEKIVGTTVDTVVLNSPGGRSGQGQCISRSIAAKRMKTFVQGGCASICFLLFAAGATKQACNDAKIGIHRPRNVETREETSGSTILEYAARYGVPRAIRERLAQTPPKDMYYLNAADLASMNVKRC